MIQLASWLQASGVWCGLALLLLFLGQAAEAQTSCATQHTTSGTFICYPNPSENSADSLLPDIFHLSAQGNPADGQAIAGYRVLIDNRLVYENNFMVPIETLSIETNLKSPFDSGSHTLQLIVRGAGSAAVKELHFYPSRNISICDPFSRTDPRTCSPSNNRAPLHWLLTETAPRASPADPFESYLAYLKLYDQNLKSIEADVSDAMAVDAQGNLYVASHAFADVDLRKYAPNGSLIYASLIRSCGDGFLSVTGLAIDNAGRAWIAGNTTACLSTTPDAIGLHVTDVNRMHGFVMLLDTKKPTSTTPIYLSYLSDVENRIAAIRVDNEGNAYVTGTAASLDFPHDSLLNADEGSTPFRAGVSFVSALNPSGSSLLWSTLLRNAQLTALSLDDAGNVYLTGRVAARVSPSGAPAKQNCGVQGKVTIGCDDVLVAELSDRGRRLSYLARFGGSADEEGQAISTIAQGAWIFVAGDTGSRPFVIGLQPCKTGALYSRLLPEVDSSIAPPIAITPVLDAFTTGLSEKFAGIGPVKAGQKPSVPIQIAPTCPPKP